MKKYFFIVFIMVLSGCVQIPERLETPVMVIKSAIEDNRGMFTLHIVATIRNPNSAVIIRDLKGRLRFRDGKSMLPESGITAIPFTVKEIFPFESAMVKLEAHGDEKQCRPVFELLGISPDDVIKAGTTREIYIHDKYLKMEINSYLTEKIHKALKGKLNEKVQ